MLDKSNKLFQINTIVHGNVGFVEELEWEKGVRSCGPEVKQGKIIMHAYNVHWEMFGWKRRG
jgi:hypothetical protein